MKRRNFNKIFFILVAFVFTLGTVSCRQSNSSRNEQIKNDKNKFVVVQKSHSNEAEIAISPQEIKKGKLVKIKILPAKGYQPVLITLDGQRLKKAEFRMPAKSVLFAVKFQKINYKINVANMRHGLLQIQSWAHFGDQINFKAKPIPGYIFDGLIMNEQIITGQQFKMPAENVDVRAFFHKKRKGEETTHSKQPILDINGNEVITGQSYYLISQGRDCDVSQKKWLASRNRRKIYFSVNKKMAQSIQIYKIGAAKQNGLLLRNNDLALFKMNDKYFNFKVKETAKIKLKNSAAGAFKLYQQNNKIKLQVGEPQFLYNQAGVLTSCYLKRSNLNDFAFYFNVEQQSNKAEISLVSDALISNYALKPVPHYTKQSGDILKFYYYNQNENLKVQQHKNLYSENGKKYKVKFHLQAQEKTKISLEYRNIKISEKNILPTKTEVIVDGPVLVLDPGINEIKIKNLNGGNLKIAYLEFVAVSNQEVVGLRPIKKEMDLDKILYVKDALSQNSAYYSANQNVVYLGDQLQYITYQISVPESGKYNLRLSEDFSQQNLISHFRILNETNNTYNEDDQIELECGLNKLKISVKPFVNSSIEKIIIKQNGTSQSTDHDATKLLKYLSENVEVQNGNIIFQRFDSYIDLKIENLVKEYQSVQIETEGQGEFILTNQWTKEKVYGVSHFENVIDQKKSVVRKILPKRELTLQPGINIIRIRPQNNGHLLQCVEVQRSFYDIIAYQ